MDEKRKADIYLVLLDKILAGEKDIGPVEDIEVEKLLLLAKTMIAEDFSINSKTREKLRKQLLNLVIKKNKLSLSVQPNGDDELDEEALNSVTAAGLTGLDRVQKAICPYCGFKSKNLESRCPICSK
ncbi:MAG: hypothetical protein SCK28_08565 [Bacillota bacterium]|nr:hypothetical protein [Bacillota bacterium]